MASLDDLLSKTMLFTAAKGQGIDPKTLKKAPDAEVKFERPTSVKDVEDADHSVWYWEHAAKTPREFRSIEALVPDMEHKIDGKTVTMDMAMPVCTRLLLESVTVRLKGSQSDIRLPLEQMFVLAK